MLVSFERTIKERGEEVFPLLDLFSSKLNVPCPITVLSILTERKGVSVQVPVKSLKEYETIRKSGKSISLYEPDFDMSFSLYGLDVSIATRYKEKFKILWRKFISDVSIVIGPEPAQPSEPDITVPWGKLASADPIIEKYQRRVKAYEKKNKSFEGRCERILEHIVPGLKELGYAQRV